MASFSCKDLHAHGVSLLPPSNADFARLLEDIRRRAQAVVTGKPPFLPKSIPDDLEFAAILLNHSGKAIVGLATEWQFEVSTGHRYSRRFSGMQGLGGNLLTPFGVPPERLAFLRYWQSIFSGSKRLLADSQMFGDNTDVRLPQGSELWRGGVGGSGGGGNSGSRSDLKGVTLLLDGAFFDDGEFVGPMRCTSGKRVTMIARLNLGRPASPQRKGLAVAALRRSSQKWIATLARR